MAGQAGMSKAMITTGYIRSGVTSELGIYIYMHDLKRHYRLQRGNSRARTQH